MAKRKLLWSLAVLQVAGNEDVLSIATGGAASISYYEYGVSSMNKALVDTVT